MPAGPEPSSACVTVFLTKDETKAFADVFNQAHRLTDLASRTFEVLYVAACHKAPNLNGQIATSMRSYPAKQFLESDIVAFVLLIGKEDIKANEALSSIKGALPKLPFRFLQSVDAFLELLPRLPVQVRLPVSSRLRNGTAGPNGWSFADKGLKLLSVRIDELIDLFEKCNGSFSKTQERSNKLLKQQPELNTSAIPKEIGEMERPLNALEVVLKALLQRQQSHRGSIETTSLQALASTSAAIASGYTGIQTIPPTSCSMNLTRFSDPPATALPAGSRDSAIATQSDDPGSFLTKFTGCPSVPEPSDYRSSIWDLFKR